MNKKSNTGAVILPLLAAVFYAINTPFSKVLLNNVAPTLIALLIFKEKVSRKLWIAIGFITLSSIVLSFEGSGSFRFSLGSFLAFAVNGEKLGITYFIGLTLMIIGTVFVVYDTMVKPGLFAHSDSKKNFIVMTEKRKRVT